MTEEKILAEIAAGVRHDITAAALACELLTARQQITLLRQRLATPVRLPFCSASPVCEIEAGYAAGVSDSRNAIRLAGYLIEGDE